MAEQRLTNGVELYEGRIPARCRHPTEHFGNAVARETGTALQNMPIIAPEIGPVVRRLQQKLQKANQNCQGETPLGLSQRNKALEKLEKVTTERDAVQRLLTGCAGVVGLGKSAVCIGCPLYKIFETVLDDREGPIPIHPDLRKEDYL